MPTVDGFDLDLENLNGYPIAIGHGTLDPVIGVGFGRQAKARLEDAGAAITYRESPMAHTIDPSFLDQLQGWLRDALVPERQE